MKKLFSFLVLILFYCVSFAQNTFPSSGSVGIGTNNPRANMEVNGTGLFQGLVNLGEWSDVALGDPVSISGGSLDDNGPTYSGAYSMWTVTSAGQSMNVDMGGNVYFNGITFGTNWKGDHRYIPSAYHIDYSTDGSTWTNLISVTGNSQPYIYHTFSLVVGRYIRLTVDSFQNGIGNAYITSFRVLSTAYVTNFGNNIWSLLPGINPNNAVLDLSGNVLIGKTTQTNSSYKLDVNGNIRANQVTVNATGADYVFGSKYKLPSLDSLSNYIKAHHHLPGIPSAKVMQHNGMNLGDAYTKLLGKVEEMTLYLVTLQKEVNELKTENNQLRKIKRP